MNYKLGLCSVSFREYSVREVLHAMKEAGLSFVEWGSDVHVPQKNLANAKKTADLQAKNGVKCSSYGTYFKIGVNQTEEILDYIKTAKILGANQLRLWCGNKNSEKYSEEEKQELFAKCRQLSKIAEQHGVVFCMECHSGTYTNTKESALELMKTVHSEHLKMYWQPNQYREERENIAYAKLLSPYTKHIHVFNWREKEKMPLQDAVEIWKTYLSCFEGEHTLLLEFMPDGRIESLKAEAEALKEIVE